MGVVVPKRLAAMAAAVLVGLVLALGAAPVFAAEEPVVEDGGTVQPQIVGGTAVPDGKYKFVAALRDLRDSGGIFQQQFCGGTLIDRDSVLTAAHCFTETGVPRSALRVTVGITDLRTKQGQARAVSAIHYHPDYDGRSYAYDAAVLELARPVRGIAPARIPATDSNDFEQAGRMATIAGWGGVYRQPPGGEEPQLYPYRMREAKVPVVSDVTAQGLYGTDDYYPPIMLAAGEEGKDTCQGDSGGPIFVRTSAAVYQIGITSFGEGCGTRNFPGVYAETNSAAIRPFIASAASR